MKVIDNFFEYLGFLLLLLNAILYLSSYNKLKRIIALKYFNLYLVVTAVVLFTSLSIVLFSENKNNLFLSHFYFIFQFLLLSLFYKEDFNPIQKRTVNLILILVPLALCIQYAMNPTLFKRFNIFEVFITSFPLVIYSIFYLYNSLSHQGRFMYINAGVLMYITTSTLIFILGDYLSMFRDNDAIRSIWTINKILYVGYLSLILVEWKKLQVKNK